MSRVFASPLFLGFDHLEQMLERASKTSSDGYPPYNIEQTAPAGLRITLAVAGFTMDDLQITQEDNQLVIRGRQTDDSQGRVFIHRGIAARQFQRAFVMAEGIEVRGAWLDNGLLHIDLARPQPPPESRRSRSASLARSPSPLCAPGPSWRAAHPPFRTRKPRARQAFEPANFKSGAASPSRAA